MGQESIDRFRNAMIFQAENEVASIIETASKKKQETLEKANHKFLEKAYNKIQKETKSINGRNKKEISSLNYNSRKEIVNHREKLVNSLFGKVEEQLKAFTITSEYEGFLKNQLQSARELLPFSADAIMYIASFDEGKKELFSDFSGEIKVDEKIKIGGFYIHYIKEKQILDLTLDASLEKERGDFITQSKLNF